MAREGYPAGRDGTDGSWPNGSTVAPSEISWLARGAFYSLTELGGTYNLANLLILGGAGVQFTTVATSFYGITCTNTATFNGNVTIGDTDGDQLTVNSIAYFLADTSFNDVVQLTGGTSGTHTTFDVGQYVNTTFHNGFNSYLAAVFYGTAAFLSTAGFGAGVSFSGGTSGTHVAFDIGQYVDTTLNGILIRATGCRERTRVLEVVDADISVAAGTYDSVIMTNVTTTRTISLLNTPWLDGEGIKISGNSLGAQSVHVLGPGGLNWYLHDYEYIEIVWSDFYSAFHFVAGGTRVFHAS